MQRRQFHAPGSVLGSHAAPRCCQLPGAPGAGLKPAPCKGAGEVITSTKANAQRHWSRPRNAC